MKRIGLIDFDSRIPNSALQKLSTHFKRQGAAVLLNDFRPSEVDEGYCSVIFTRNKAKAARLADIYPNITFGGTGWDLTTTLPPEVESCRPDYTLYQVKDILPRLKGIMTAKKKLEKCHTLLNAGIGYLTRGCVRSCGFCFVPKKEGALRRVASIGDLLNSNSSTLCLLDNNLTASPDCLEILREIKDRNLTVNISQGVDIRFLTPEISKVLSEVRHLTSLTYAWDLMPFEDKVMEGIKILSRDVKPYKHQCFCLAGYNTTFEEDMYRVRKLAELGITPFLMVWNEKPDLRLQHLKRWVNGKFHKVCRFEDYEPWVRDRARYASALF